jgi:hypothetical protein
VVPVKVRFRGAEEVVVSWKDAFIKLLKQFDTSNSGLLLRIATEQTLHAVISVDRERFRRSKFQIGDVYVNTHASAAQLRDWCRKIAKLASIGANEFEFVMPNESSNQIV